ncbi:glycosyltransferase [Pseudoalteromonas sp. MB47]|uniref:glycosyltransferase n=1 Tax=Pseudoalteromonas sp. MB47 TaxID=2588452 RepID=UPI00140D7F5F|nr:glycosyltransferase [Pseudoalteromonas sp. MB47]NHH89283.1 putative glycosyltransferase EpsF [Pseudoalteromonas sp. MB47]
MHITHIIIGLKVGGAELMLERLITQTSNKSGVKHSVISFTSLGDIGLRLINAGVVVKTLGMKGFPSFILAFPYTRMILKELKPDLVQTWMYHADFIGGLAARTLGIKNVIWNVRNTNVKKDRLGSYLFRRMCGFFSHILPKHIIYVSHSAKREHSKNGFMFSNSTVIGNGFDTDKFKFSQEHRDFFRKEIQLSDDEIAVFSVGRFDKAKDHKTFINAICKAREKNPKIKGILIGRGIILEQFDLTDTQMSGFINVGQVSNVHELLSAADIFCLHSITEGFPNVLGEAMSVGLPCIATKAGDAELILEQPHYTVDVGDYYLISDLILELSKSVFLDSVGNINRERVINFYSLEQVICSYIDLYKEVCFE